MLVRFGRGLIVNKTAKINLCIKNAINLSVFKGHAQYSYSNDIVCSSVSTAIIVTINAIEWAPKRPKFRAI
ncbi:ribosomal-processing cysteine protease Prp ['Crotalaria aegyptiaca' phytoplasma]|uniref:Ribosomal processing cysteine protease Prp n=1 Tax=Candidatus Phytoplasma crotalariae TaxID=2982627 RepID=A0ABT9D2Z8_9MOLU|nr:ribosomal-processing cysteine protease Prp ['Crotalaria aegyptiaca' phytoplasma]MDO8059397.1 ribosomal-processing cysteine protease Prp ['Crotalaria aegyptiaca' phytoplasma]